MNRPVFELTPIFTAKRPPPPDGLPPDAAALWVSICAGVDSNYFAGADLTLLEALVTADHHKRACDRLVSDNGPILADGTVNPAAKLSNQYAATMSATSLLVRQVSEQRTQVANPRHYAVSQSRQLPDAGQRSVGRTR